MPVAFASNQIFHGLDLLVGILLIITGFLSFSGTFERIILPIYIIGFGIAVCIFAFIIPTMLGVQIGFYYNFLGRGLAFLFLGCLVLVMSGSGLHLATAIITLIIAFLYVFLWIFARLGLLPCVLPPPIVQRDSEGTTTTTQSSTTTTTTTTTQQSV